MTSFTAYQRRLFVFLSVATFFEGYDFLALAQLLPNIRAEFQLSPGQAGKLVAAINVGTVLAYVLVRLADQWGRRRVMALTILGYTLCSGLTAAATGPVSFAVFQVLARIFLIAEWAIAMVYAAEEFPADRRGMVMGVIQGCSGLGAVVCAAVVPQLVKAPLGWRTVYVAGAVPLLLLAVARRSLRETSRFEAQKAPAPDDLGRIWRTPHRGRLMLMAGVWFSSYLCSNTAITFWKEFAVSERGWKDAEVGGAVATAALVAMPLSFAVGGLLDAIGRRWGAVIVCGVMSLSCVAAYTLHAPVGLTVALIGAMFGASATLTVFNTLTSELFPTEFRADAFAWSNNLLGRLGYVAAPLIVGAVAERHGWGLSVAATAIGPIIALLLVVLGLPETRGRELEETSRVGPPPAPPARAPVPSGPPASGPPASGPPASGPPASSPPASSPPASSPPASPASSPPASGHTPSAPPAPRRASSLPPPAPQRLPRVNLDEPGEEEVTLVTMLTPDMMVPGKATPGKVAPADEAPAAIAVRTHTEGAEQDEPTHTGMLILVTAVAQSDKGRRRRRNEDSFRVLDDHSVFVVADGMGGHLGGEVASQLTVQVIGEIFEQGKFPGEPVEGVPRRADELVRAVREANARVHRRSLTDPELTGMGTTVVAARFSATKRRAYIAHVGDSRCYRIRDGVLTQLTSDHTLGVVAGIGGLLGERLTRAVGLQETVDVDLQLDIPTPRDIYLLCSDGLTKMVPDEMIREILAGTADLEQAAQTLVARANERGGADNITVVLVRVDPVSTAGLDPG